MGINSFLSSVTKPITSGIQTITKPITDFIRPIPEEQLFVAGVTGANLAGGGSLLGSTSSTASTTSTAAGKYNNLGGNFLSEGTVKPMGLFDTITQGLTSFGSGLTSIVKPIGQLGQTYGALKGNNFDFSKPIETSGQNTNFLTEGQENANSGSFGMNPNQAGFGALIPGFTNLARPLLNRPISTAIGTGILGALADNIMTDSGKPLRITKRMKSQVRKIYNIAGMNAELTANFMNNTAFYGKTGYTAQDVFMILTKRMRNDGQFVTRAAIRKTRSTINKMKSMQKLLNEVTTRAPARRRSPAATSNVRLISNK